MLIEMSFSDSDANNWAMSELVCRLDISLVATKFVAHRSSFSVAESMGIIESQLNRISIYEHQTHNKIY